MTSETEPLGQPFTGSYRKPAEPLPDSRRARVRLGTHLRMLLTRGGSSDWFDYQEFVKRKCGIDLDAHNEYVVDQELQKLPIEDLLDVITHTYRYFVSRGLGGDVLWLGEVRLIFQQEHLAYRVDEKCGIHPLIDNAFESQRQSTIGVLNSFRYNATRLLLEGAIEAMEESPPNTRSAVRQIFEAAENLAKIVTKTNKDLDERLVKSDVDAFIRSSGGAADASQNQASSRLVTSFAHWVNAGHAYRHAKSDTELHVPELNFAIAYLSSGMAFLRWFAELDGSKGSV